MNQSDLFSYLSAFVTIVLAVALGDMIQSTHRLIRGRRRVQWDVLPLTFAAMVVLTLVSEFFSLWDSFAVTDVSFWRLIWMLAPPTLLALLAYSVLPDEVPEGGLDLTKFYDDERRTWVIIFGLAYVLDIVRSFELIAHNRDWAIEYAGHVAWRVPILAFALTLIWSGRTRRWSIAGVALLTASMIYGLSIWTISARG